MEREHERLAAAEPAAAAPARRPLPDDLRAQLERSYAVDLSAVAVVEDGVAEQLGKPAAARGCDLHFARGAYDPVGDAGRHVIAHEVAHVVQQGAVPRTSAATDAHVSESPTGSLEQEAELAAFAALRGQAARLSHGRAGTGLQGYESWEHWLIAMLGSGGKMYTFGTLMVSQGDICALSGDYFDPHPDAPAEDSLSVHLRVPSMMPGKCPGTQDEILAALQDWTPHDPRRAPGGPWSDIVISDDVKQSMKQRYSRLAVRNIDHFAAPTKGSGLMRERASAGGSYRAMHESAIWTAYFAGTQWAGDSSEADLLEAAAEHFLTDSFSAGHIRTPRADLKSYWETLYPDFAQNLVRAMALRIAESMTDNNAADVLVCILNAGARDAELGILYAKVHGQILDKLGARGVPGIGDLLSLVSHNHDNEIGLDVENDLGMTWHAMGDGHLLDGGANRIPPIVAAVRLGCADVERAFQLGKTAPGKRQAEVLAAIRASAPAPAVPCGKYAPEQFMPRPVAGKNGDQTVYAANFEALLDQRIRSDGPTTFRMRLTEEARPGGAIYEQLAGIAASLDERKALVYAPRQAFEEGVLEPLSNDPIGMLTEIAAGVP